ncbi:MAG: nuclear transport factor 2 family protein [Flavisolibacter sp.]
MKRVFILAATGFFSVVCLDSQAQQNTNAMQAKNTATDRKGPTTNISIGNPVYAQKVMQAWKDYDNNTMDNMDDLIADDVVATFPDGSMVKGRDNFVKMIRDYRNGFASVSSKIMACTTLKTPDDPEHEVVTIWGEETDTAADGTVTKTHLNEVWFFNKQGKLTEFHQMAAKDSPDKK